ncbi:DUF2062 domain-containing protein [Cohnella sp.]|uniref:DUF2062 domain-containing protein n=1 Tax=Cohnella sp. TaxID=1883426 RepID=UPI0035696527
MISKLLRKLSYYFLRMIRNTGGNHAIATGLVIGFFPCWFPTFGVGMIFSVGLTRFARGNVPASVLSATIGSLMWPFLFYLNYKIGLILRSIVVSNPVQINEELFGPMAETDYEETADQLGTLGSIGMDFLVGSAFNSILFTVAGYFVIRAVLNRYRLPLLTLLRKRRRNKSKIR